MSDTPEPTPPHWEKAIADLQRLADHLRAALDRSEQARARLQADVVRLEGELDAAETHVRILQGRMTTSRPANIPEPTMKHVIDVLQQALATRKREHKREVQRVGTDARTEELADQVKQLEDGILLLVTPVVIPERESQPTGEEPAGKSAEQLEAEGSAAHEQQAEESNNTPVATPAPEPAATETAPAAPESEAPATEPAKES